MMKWRLAAITFILGCNLMLACPWCSKGPSLQPTTYADSTNTGGLFFGKTPPIEKVRRYFVAAEMVPWNFEPAGNDPVKGMPVPLLFRVPGTATALRYVEYTDATFVTTVPQSENLGMMGPVLRGMTGEYLVVTFLNRTAQPLSMHPHGVKYDKDSEGASYFPSRGAGAAVAPQARFTYVWHLDDAAGPSETEPSTKPWLYHSHVVTHEEINRGLFGFIVVTDPKRAQKSGLPKDIDREIATCFVIVHHPPQEEEEEIAPHAPAAKDPNYVLHNSLKYLQGLRDFERSAKHTINGRSFGALTGLNLKEGERVRWYLFALGSEQDLHTAHWHGQRVKYEGKFTDVVELLPGSMKTVNFVADNPGTWLFECHVGDHMMEGMYSQFTIHSMMPETMRTNGLYRISPLETK